MTTLALVFATMTQTFNLPPGLLSSVCWVESKHDERAFNSDDKGSDSIGLCQIKLATARNLGYRGSVSELQNSAKINAYYAAKYLHRQLVRYGGDIAKAVAAYNAGTYRIDQNGRIKNYKYVNKVFVAWASNQ